MRWKRFRVILFIDISKRFPPHPLRYAQHLPLKGKADLFNIHSLVVLTDAEQHLGKSQTR